MDARVIAAKRDPVKAGILEDVRSSAAHLTARHAGGGVSEDDRRQEIQQLDADRRRAREVELEHGVSILPTRPRGAGLEADQGEFRAFSQPELGQLGGILARLPAAHLAGNENLNFIRRQQRGPQADLGALYKSGESGLDIYDQPQGVTYRATGEESELGEHDAGHRVTPLDEVATHEIGHAVERQYPQAFAKIKEAAGWSEYRTADDAKAALRAHDMSRFSAWRGISALEASRNASFHEQQPLVHNGYEYRAHPDKAGQFTRRRLNRMPGDAATPESAGRSHVDYAKTSPNEHFAELYAQMVHVPERTYADYVQGPKDRLDAALQLHTASATAHLAAIGAHGEASQQAREAKRLMDARERVVAERWEQHHALSKQWDVMREEVFGVNQQAVEEQEASIRTQARQRNLDEDAAARHFQLHARKAATPRQLRRLGERALGQAPPRPQPLVEAQPVALGGGGEDEGE